MTVFNKKQADIFRYRLSKLFDTLEFTYVVADDCEDFIKSLDKMNKQVQTFRRHYREEEMEDGCYWTVPEE